ncbi:MAG: ATP-grasp domain-containing protein [Thermomicrobiales bacterium]
MTAKPLKVGLIVGREWSFPPAFIDEVNGRDEGVVAEFVKLGGTRMEDPCDYAVLIDRISHEVPYYRTYLKQAVLQGATVVNNPFMWTADDKLFGAALATKLGIASPKTIALPNKEYVPGIVHNESLRNLVYPLDWDMIIEYIGLPCILKDAHGVGWKEVYVCRSLDEVWYHYNNSGLLTMILQEFIEWDQFVRCLCIGQEEVLPIRYDPTERKYHVDHAHLTPDLGRRIVDDSLKLVRALGYDMNSMEWAIRDGVPYAIDFMNPAPDMDIYSLTPHYFEWAVKHMADMAIRLAKHPRPQARDLRWDSFFIGRRQEAARPAALAAATNAPLPGPSDSAPPADVTSAGAPLGAASPAALTAAGVPEETPVTPPARRTRQASSTKATEAPAPKSPTRGRRKKDAPAE